MSTPNPFTVDQEHWDLIVLFIGLKAAEDGVVDQGEMIDLMRQYWLLLNDLDVLKAEVAAIELEQLEGALDETKQAVVDQQKEIADRKGRGGPPRTTPKPPIPEPPEPREPGPPAPEPRNRG